MPNGPLKTPTPKAGVSAVMTSTEFKKLEDELNRYDIFLDLQTMGTPVVSGKALTELVSLDELNKGLYTTTKSIEWKNHKRVKKILAGRRTGANVGENNSNNNLAGKEDSEQPPSTNWKEHAKIWTKWANKAIAGRTLEEGWSKSRKAAVAALLCGQFRSFPKELIESLDALHFPNNKRSPLVTNRIVHHMCGVSEGLIGCAITEYKSQRQRFFAILRGADLVFDTKRKSRSLPEFHINRKGEQLKKRHVVVLTNPSLVGTLDSPNQFDLIIVEGDETSLAWMPVWDIWAHKKISGCIIFLRSDEQKPDCKWICAILKKYDFETSRREAVLIVPERSDSEGIWEWAMLRSLRSRPVTFCGDNAFCHTPLLGSRGVYYAPLMQPRGTIRFLSATWREVLHECLAKDGNALALNLSSENLVAIVDATKTDGTLFIDQWSANRWPDVLDTLHNKRPYKRKRNAPKLNVLKRGV
jgi:hypothetical protein